jgi:hypothetical protein
MSDFHRYRILLASASILAAVSVATPLAATEVQANKPAVAAERTRVAIPRPRPAVRSAPVRYAWLEQQRPSAPRWFSVLFLGVGF